MSLSWCLAQLTKSSPSPGSPSSGLTGADVKAVTGREAYKRLRAGQWKALVAIRTQHIKGGSSRLVRFRTQGGLHPLLDILRRPESSRKILDLALSILANCCTEKHTRAEVRGGKPWLEVLKRQVSVETVENRAARTLGNLAVDPEGSSQVHSAAQAPSSAKLERAQSAARALFYLSDTPANRLALLSQGTLPALTPFLSPEYPPGLRRAALRAVHELTRGCGAECAREVSASGALAQLGVLASGEGGRPLEELALKTLANLCSQGCLRPLVGSLGVIQKFTGEVKRDPLRSGVFFKALCLCCKEAVNRAKVKESGGLEVLIGFLAAHHNHPLTRLAILACVDFVYDESALEQLQELGLVPLLVARLVELAKGEELSAGKMDASLTSGPQCSELMASCFDSFDFPPPEGSRREEVGKEQGPGSSSFLSLRSWLVSEGLISSEGELMDSPCVLDGDGSNPYSFCSRSSSSSSPCPTPVSDAQKPLSWPKPSCLSSSAAPGAPPPPIPPPLLLPSSKPPVYLHPYHPEPWAPESPILLLLSRFSHAADPSAALLGATIFSGLLYYLTHHPDPSGRCFRLLARLSCNPNCLQALVRSGAVSLLRYRLYITSKSHLNPPPVPAGQGLLSNVRVQSETAFGTGVLTHTILSGSEADKLFCVLSLPLITRYVQLLVACSKVGLDRSKCVSDIAVEAPFNPVRSPQLLRGPQISEPCPYQASSYDLSFLLDDGTLLPANRVAVAGEEGMEEVGSEYFRALLRGGFGEARRSSGEAVPIGDVSSGVLFPVLHYLHGCRMSSTTHVCPLLSSLVSGGLAGHVAFQKSPLAEVMIGASRFLVSGLQQAAEDHCRSLISSVALPDDRAGMEAQRGARRELCLEMMGRGQFEFWICSLDHVSFGLYSCSSYEVADVVSSFTLSFFFIISTVLVLYIIICKIRLVISSSFLRTFCTLVFLN
uniref:BTB domain-containing protein n=1 Tax=Electrophorus electricus TaxID=8005 RepID=A0A4W4FYH7_ELEEL